ncbi:hypothetical protein EDB87DRAFT_1145594 [Lactarius vividus]|nr:hypothetical protein EDB87DRAFT_1145594 [Lactarius vividus]
MHFLKYLDTRALVQYVSSPQSVITSSEFSQTGRVTWQLSDNVLLNIFRYYLDVSPRHWPRLVHICRRWRRIVFASQRSLRLQMFCTHGMPVLKTLNCWPAMPIVVRYGGSPELCPPAPKDEENITAALKQSGRVISINLTVTKSLLKKLTAIERPFSQLEDLVLLSRDSVPLTLPSAFRFFILPRVSWTFSFAKFSILGSSHQKCSQMHCPGWPIFNHFRSISSLLPITPSVTVS